MDGNNGLLLSSHSSKSTSLCAYLRRHTTEGNFMKWITCLAFAVMLFAGSAGAVEPRSPGLGASVPAAADQSVNPNWRVYAIDSNGIRFVQVNDAAGNVRGGVAVGTGGMISIPLGAGDLKVFSTAAGAPAASSPIYDDGVVTVSEGADNSLIATPSSAATTCTNPVICGIPVTTEK